MDRKLKNFVKGIIIVVLSGIVAPGVLYALPITSTSFFSGPGTVTIDFETFPGSLSITPDGTALTTQYSSLGVLFSSEDDPNALQTTDAADAFGRFEDPFRVLALKSGGGSPSSGVRYAAGDEHLGFGTSDMRIDFITPVNAFGMQVIDNDFTDVRIAAFNSSGTLLETVIAPEVSEGGSAFWGINVPGVSYVIVDGAADGDLNSTFIDDLMYQPVPEPSTVVLLGAALLAWFFYGWHRRMRVQKKK